MFSYNDSIRRNLHSRYSSGVIRIFNKIDYNITPTKKKFKELFIPPFYYTDYDEELLTLVGFFNDYYNNDILRVETEKYPEIGRFFGVPIKHVIKFLEEYNINKGEFKINNDYSSFVKNDNICLYRVDLTNFKLIKENRYVDSTGLAYDILNDFNSKFNFFIKAFDYNGLYYTFFDKMILDSYITMLESFEDIFNAKYDVDVPIVRRILLLTNFLLNENCYNKLNFVDNNFDLLKSYFMRSNKNRTLQTDVWNTHTYVNSMFRSTYYPRSTMNINFNTDIVDDGYYALVNCIHNEVIKDIILNHNIEKYSHALNYTFNNSIFEDVFDIFLNTYNHRLWYYDCVVFEKDISYPIYLWTKFLKYHLLTSKEYNIYVDPILEKRKINKKRKDFPYVNNKKDIIITSMETFFNSLKNYEKSKYFYTKDDFNNKILNNGISF